MATTLAKATRSSSEQSEGVHPGAVQEDRVDEITRLTNTVRYLGEQAKARDREFTKIITSLRHTRNQRARKKLWERGNAVAAALVALEAVYRNLMAVLVSLKAQASGMLAHPPAGATRGCSRYPKQRPATSSTSTTASNTPQTPPQDPESTPRIRKLAALSDAFSLYSGYFYPWVSRRAAALVDPEVMQARWPARTELRNDPRARPVSFDGFVPDGAPCAEPALWLLACVAAALATLFSPAGGAGEREEEDAAFKLVSEVFDAAAAAYGQKHERVFSEGCFAARLRADIGFWEAFARERGLLAAAAEGESVICLDELVEGDRDDVFALLNWLVGAHDEDSTARGQVGQEIVIKSHASRCAVETLVRLGLKISCRSQGDGASDGDDGKAETVVFLDEADSCPSESVESADFADSLCAEEKRRADSCKKGGECDSEHVEVIAEESVRGSLVDGVQRSSLSS